MSHRIGETPEAYSVGKVEHPDRGENCALNRYLPLLLLDTQELQQGFDMEGIDQAADPHHPREHMHRPPCSV